MRMLRKRGLALLLCLVMLLSCIASVYAAEVEQEEAELETAAEEASEAESVQDEADADEPESEEEIEVTEEVLPEEDAIIQAAAAAAASYTFSSIVTSSQMTSANNYLNYTGGSGTKAVPIHQVTFGGKTYWAYCADSRKDWPGSSYSNYTEESLPTSGMYQVQKVAMQLGFGDNNVSRLKTIFGYDLSNYEAYQATQVVLWAAQVWVNQWNYIGSAPATIRDGVTNYWKVATASDKSANARNFALALAHAVQAVYENGIGCTVTVTEDSSASATQKFKVVVKPKNYFGGYSATISGLPSGAVLASSDGDVTVSKASAFSSTAASGTDTLYITVPKTASAQSLNLTVTVTPKIQTYTSNSAVGYLGSASSTYQNVLYAAGNLSTAPVTEKLSLKVPRLPNGQITITKKDADTGAAVKGVVFELYEYDGSAYNATGKTATTNASGVATFTIQYNATNIGRFRIYEKSSTTHQVYTNRYVAWVSLASGLWYGYESSTAEQKTGTATKNTNGSYDFTFAFTAKNPPKTGSLTVIKADVETGKPLAGCVFALYERKVPTAWTDKDGEWVATGKTVTTDSNGKAVFSDLAITSANVGKWQVREVSAPSGYEPDAKFQANIKLGTGYYSYGSSFTGSINGHLADGESASGTVEGQTKMLVSAKASSGQSFDFTVYAFDEPSAGTLTIRKEDRSGKSMSGVSFVVTDSKGNSVLCAKNSDGTFSTSDKGSAQLTTDSKGKIVLTGLPYGTYLVTEVKTGSGGTTLLPTSFSVTLPYTDKNGTTQPELTCTVINSPGFTLPATGGSGSVAPVCAGLVLLSLAFLLYIHRNRKGEFAQ